MPDYTRKKNISFINPYTFVPAPRRQHVNRSPLQSLPSAQLHTGVLRCRLYVRTPLGIPDVEGAGEDQEYPFFAYEENGSRVPAIPGSSLRGPVRAVFEAASDSCFSTLRENTGLSKRAESRKAYKPGILKWEKGAWHLYRAERYLLAVDPKGQEEGPADKNYTKYEGLPLDAYVSIFRKGGDGFRFARTQNGEELRFGDMVEFRAYTEGKAVYTKNHYQIWSGAAGDVRKKETGIQCPPGRKSGLIYIGETFAGRKHGESVFVSKGEIKELTGEVLKKAYEGLLETLEIYRNPAINRSRGHSGYEDFEHADRERGIPVWYSEKEGKLSLASIGRTFYNTSLNELLGERQPCVDRKKLCEACALFGMAGEESLGSRIRFTDGRVSGNYKFDRAALKILGQPRYSYLPFYARNGEGVLTAPDSYDGKNVEIAGRKFYWHNPKAAEDRSIYDAEKKNKMNSTLQLIKPGAEFCFDIYYDGVTEEQLEKLMWCIHFGENTADGDLCHKLGHGKPLGLGSVKIVIEKNEERIFREGIYRWEEKAMPEPGVEPALKNGRALKKVMSFRGPDGNTPIRYPYICDEDGRELTESGSNEDARHVWYQKNKDAGRDRNDSVELLPDILAKNQALHPYQKMEGGGYQNRYWDKGGNSRR